MVRAFGLTARAAELLVWLARGKTQRDGVAGASADGAAAELAPPRQGRIHNGQEGVEP
jgi:hypothetical protein